MKFILSILFILSITLFATDFYISPAGSDNTGDGSVTNPWRTLDEAANHLLPGDIVFARGGIYSNTESTIRCDGSPDNPITFQAYPGENPIFDGSVADISENESIIKLSKAHNVILYGLEVQDSAGRGISVSASTNVIIKNCIVHDINFRGIGCNGFNISIISNEVFNCCLTNKNGLFGSGGWPAAINSTKIWETGEMSSNIVLSGNYVHDCWGEGIIALKAFNIKVENNIVKDCYSCLLYIDGSCNVSAQKNYLYVTTNLYNRSDNGNAASGINIAIEKAEALPVTNVIIANNLVVNSQKAVGFWRDSSNDSDNNYYSDLKIWYNTFVSNYYAIKMNEVILTTQNNLFQNNIVVGGKFDCSNTNAWTFSHNCWSEGVPAQADEPNSFAAEPDFINFEIGGAPEGYQVFDYSSIIAKGTPVPEIQDDYWNVKRDVVAPTLGFYEPIPEPVLFINFYLIFIIYYRRRKFKLIFF